MIMKTTTIGKASRFLKFMKKPIYVEIRLKKVITKEDHHEDKVLPIFPLSIISTVEEEKENYPSYHHKNDEDI